MGVALVRIECFKNQILYIFISHVPTIIFIIYILDVIDSLGNYIFINIYYRPIYRVLRGEIHRRKT
jgi:hypothetical protein